MPSRASDNAQPDAGSRVRVYSPAFYFTLGFANSVLEGAKVALTSAVTPGTNPVSVWAGLCDLCPVPSHSGQPFASAK